MTFDESMTIEQHVKNVCKSTYDRNIAKIRDCLTQHDSETFIHAFISSKLDFFNSLLNGLPKYVLGRLQCVQNSAARLIT